MNYDQYSLEVLEEVSNLYTKMRNHLLSSNSNAFNISASSNETFEVISDFANFSFTINGFGLTEEHKVVYHIEMYISNQENAKIITDNLLIFTVWGPISHEDTTQLITANSSNDEAYKVFVKWCDYVKRYSSLYHIKDKYLPKQTTSSQPENKFSSSKEVFVVHGHNKELLYDVDRTLQKLGLRGVILNEKAKAGKSILQNFKDHSNVGFAIILLTDDDIGRAKSDETMNDRARQNVIFEWGYLMAKIESANVYVLYKKGVELPSDLIGMLYTELDAAGAWRYELVKELQHAGYDVKADDLH